MHPPYRLDRLLSDCHLLVSLSNALSYKTFSVEVDLNQGLQDFFASESKQFIMVAFKTCPKKGVH